MWALNGEFPTDLWSVLSSTLAWVTVANGQQGPRKRQGWPPPARDEVHKPQSRLQGTAKRLWLLLQGGFVNRSRRADGWQPRTSREGWLANFSHLGWTCLRGGGRNEKMFAAGKREVPNVILSSHTEALLCTMTGCGPV